MMKDKAGARQRMRKPMQRGPEKREIPEGEGERKDWVRSVGDSGGGENVGGKVASSIHHMGKKCDGRNLEREGGR
jgi:hypothetical protein